MKLDPKTTATVWSRLSSGKPFWDLQLPTVEGRTDLRGIAAPEPSVVRERKTTVTRPGHSVSGNVQELGGLLVIRGVRLRKLDFSKANLSRLQFMDAEIEDCRFDGAKCRDWRVWGTTMRQCTFRAADLRGSALAGVGERGRRNAFEDVVFAGTDLRQTSYQTADMTRCTFDRAKLSKVDFQGTVFVDCTFVGELREVLFYRRRFQDTTSPPNEMKNVDLRAATLRWSQFRELDMDTVKWPESDDQVVLDDYAAALRRVLSVVRTRTDSASKQITAVLENDLKWVGPRQKQGVISKEDLREMGGEEAVAEFLRLARPN